ncbi:MAG TPA: fatty acid cis/trans isomerase, partial [Myxococcota bacterium]|nr:fatty acid cis/trans isomerase [Myxococcota bacterium]
MPLRRLPLLALALVVLAATSGIATCTGPGGWMGPELPPPKLARLEGLDRAVDFERDVRPVLESRCVVCHACYDGPCQLLLSSPEGIARGATKEVVYDTTRIRAADPTRLFVDAHTTAEWRAKGFFSVLGGMHEPTLGDVTPANRALATQTTLLEMLALGAANPFPPGERLPESVGLDIQRPLTCARANEFDAYAREHPNGGMPYGMAPLADDELRILVAWVMQGAPMPATPKPVPARAQQEVAQWETFLNGTDLTHRVVSRYLYEHWFVAHLYFADLPAGPFFKVVRSRTPSGRPIDEIPTRRPYDDPGPELYYRLEPVEGTIVHKTHITYELSPERMAHLTKLFLGKDWKATELPAYTDDVASNPFVAFEEIPPRARYQFLLDDAQFFVDTFIRGPVCRGEVAVDVIEDHFWVSFLDPDHDLSITNPDYLAKTKHLLDLPSEDAGWLEYNRKQRLYLNERQRFYDQADPKRLGPALDWVWDGDGSNRSALLTVFRNFDNATVVKGFVGDIPKTAWIMDYPIFERIYYDLVAGYDVFGSVTHQVATRLYMDHLRMQSENLLLAFLPADRREEIRASWYVGARRQVDYFLVDRLRAEDHGTQVKFTGPDVKAEFLEQVLGRSPVVAGPPDLLNRCGSPPCDRPGASPVEREVERELQ